MPTRQRDFLLVLILISSIAVAGARPYAGAWNDGSRLAAVESLVDRNTFAIDDSMFVQIPIDSSPYGPANPGLHLTGTLDKLRINGHYYSDKSPVPTLLLAAVYKIAQLLTGLRAAQSPAAFCWLMNFVGGGLPYIVAVAAIFGIASHYQLSRRVTWLLTLSFALATIAPAYSHHVNNHILQLSTTAVSILIMLRIAPCAGLRSGTPIATNSRWLLLGFITGLGYTIDLGLGPPLLAATSGWGIHQCWQRRQLTPLLFFTGAALPWLITHHAINYAIAGTMGPANARPEYLDWPGSPFDSTSMTGRWNHPSLGWAILYALDLLVGQRGILGNNLPTYLALVALPLILGNRHRERSVILAHLAWCGGGFLAYAATSNNYAGMCLSIRWFVPMLAPAFLLIASLLRERPAFARDLLLLSGYGCVWAFAGWLGGPWQRPPLALYWATMLGGLSLWALWRWRRWRKLLATDSLQVHHLTLQFSSPAANNTVSATS